MSSISDAQDRLVKRATGDIDLLLHELKQLAKKLDAVNEHAEQSQELVKHIEDTLNTLESFTANREEILRIDHSGFSEAICIIDIDILILALSELTSDCLQKIKNAIREVERS